MKKNIKKFIPAMMAVSMLATSVVFANTADKTVEASLITPAKQTTENDNSTENKVDKVLAVKLVENNGVKIFPVREVFEQLGFEIGYDNVTKIVTLSKDALYVTFSQKADAYTFSKMAPQKLGQAPIVIEGKTYVPVSLLTEIMGMEGVTVEDLTLTIKMEDTATETLENAKVLPILNKTIITAIDEKNNTITVSDEEKGEVVLNIKDLKIEYTTEAKSLAVGQAVEVVYGDAMTTSEPPVNTPKALKVINKYSLVKVISLEEDKDTKKLLVEDEKLGEVALIISKDTKINDIEKFEEGQILKVAMSDAMTMSLPPQTVAKEISIFDIEKLDIEEKDEEKEAVEVKIVEFDKENKQITIEDEKLGKVVLNITDEVKLESEENQDKKLDNFDWAKKDAKIKVVYGDIMTRSLPPINNPVKIIVLK